MLKFNIIEVINKMIGLIIIAILARILNKDFGTYLYYQNIFGYLYAIALFSSDYNFLVNYKIDKQYLHSTAYYQTIFIKFVLVVLVVLASLFYLIPHYSTFAFWPYIIAVASSLFVYDFILYIEDDKKKLILFRFISQIITLGGAFLFYFQWLSIYYVTIIQALQTIILTLGTFWASKRYVPQKINFKELFQAVKKITLPGLGNISSYFLFRNFIIFFTTIEMVILASRQMMHDRDIFAEGLRLSGVLMPFALFYINFNIQKIKKGYYTTITLIAVLLLLVSPLYVLAFMGKTFISRTFFYNFFIWAFVFNAFLEKDYVELLTSKNNRKKWLLLFNTIFFSASVLAFYFIVGYYAISLSTIIILFTVKLLVYYLLLINTFQLKIKNAGVLTAYATILLINIFLHYTGYYSFAFSYLFQLKNAFL